VLLMNISSSSEGVDVGFDVSEVEKVSAPQNGNL